VPTIRASREFELVGLIDRRPGRAREMAARAGHVRYAESASLSAVDWLGEVDAVAVATNPHDHAALVSEAVAARKHVLTEKPFAMTREEGRQMARLAADTGVSLAVVHNFQFARSTRALERDIHAGTLGHINGVWAFQFGNPGRRLPTWYESLPFGLFYDESPHLLYLLRRFSGGRLRLVTADACRSAQASRATPATVYARFEGGSKGASIPATLNLFFEAPVSEWYFVVLGATGLGVVDVFRDIYVRLPNDGTHSTAEVLRTSVSGTLQHWLQHVTSGALHLSGRLRYGNDVVYQRFAESIRSGRPAADVSAEDGLAVLEIQHEIIEACGGVRGTQ
jgi:predicted dehydrogenase